MVVADIYLGATYDARMELPGWQMPGYFNADGSVAVKVPPSVIRSSTSDNGRARTDARSTSAVDAARWHPPPVLPSPLLPGVGVLRAHVMPQVRQCSAFTPRSIRWYPRTATAPAGGWVVDFGQNIAGTVQLKIPAAMISSAPAGSSIIVRHSEVLWPNGASFLSDLNAVAARFKSGRNPALLSGGLIVNLCLSGIVGILEHPLEPLSLSVWSGCGLIVGIVW